MSRQPTGDDRRSRDTWSRWLWTWSAIQTPLVCLGILDWGPATVLVVTGVGAVLGLLVAVTWASTEPDAVRARLARLPTVSLTVCTALAAVAVPLLARTPGVIVACVIAVAVFTSPARVHRHGGAQKEEPEPPGEVVEPLSSPAPGPVGAAAPDVEVMTEEELCTAWRHSFRALETARSVPEAVRVVTLRQTFLDELESRNEPGLRAWLASGGRAASGPDRFLRGPVPLHRQLPAWPPNQAPAGE